eukprot:TRINITY_DN5083_c0_g1_i1.p1 TRINITY_DN5083_c0_g1~~TRINITY_DN5083_c0_g1_i1.p1  ORF type:complete len:363 (-),score=78.90 TRINITY_DN5083_c0_g1_i1:40-1098(-)
MLNLRLRSKIGNVHLPNVNGITTFSDFQQIVAEKTKIQPSNQKLVSGFPVKEVVCSPSTPISSVFKNGDMITVEERAAVQNVVVQTTEKLPSVDSSLSQKEQTQHQTKESPNKTITNNPTQTETKINHPSSVSNPTLNIQEPGFIKEEGVVNRRIIPDDNSCLFNAIAYVLEEKSSSKSNILRNIIADAVRKDSVTWSPAILGKPVNDYCRAITQPNTWGGAVELSIFAKYYQTEIAAFDVTTSRLNCFGEGNNYKQRVYLLYDGIHYDALAFSLGPELPKDLDITIFSPKDKAMELKFRDLITKEHKAGNYTNTAQFKLLCKQCNNIFVGESGATLHAKKTGHTNFEEAPK